MPVSSTPAVERVARVLAGLKLSLNAEGADPHAGDAVDTEWQDEIENALAVLRTLREPDDDMAAVGDVKTWDRMIAAALGEPAEPKEPDYTPPEPGTDPLHEGP
jgi:hypothetical protein